MALASESSWRPILTERRAQNFECEAALPSPSPDRSNRPAGHAGVRPASEPGYLDLDAGLVLKNASSLLMLSTLSMRDQAYRLTVLHHRATAVCQPGAIHSSDAAGRSWRASLR